MIELPKLKVVEHGWSHRISPDEGDKHCLWLTKAQANEIIRRCKAYEGLEKAMRKLLNMGNAGEGCATCHLHPTNLCDCATEKKEVILQALEALTEAEDA
ncbi:hypothetical protein LCGC14_2597660 [marine sediment metagenome]|uniref:Uncharacterized protein n=1 Tax=marine sediment metagenome TaxID=412755 RepID=A0A0F9A9Z9_9ZZZZ